MQRRKKLSTTIGPDNYVYLHHQVKAGRAANVGEAVDKAIQIARRFENRAKLERDTTAYFAGLSPEALAEETALEGALSAATVEVGFPGESTGYYA